ncbi:MAG: hypothetical protein JY451_02780 [Erythrobacter sp.]|nr:MAG: hypothetical protein JY451_02780 [Erythrobacter sp.]
MKKPIAFLLPAAALACTACVADDDQPPEEIAGLSTERECFFVSQVNGYSEAPDGRRGERLYVSTGVNERYLLETFGACPDLDWNYRIGLDARFQSSLCPGDTARLIVPRSLDGSPDTCTVTVLGKMVEE